MSFFRSVSTDFLRRLVKAAGGAMLSSRAYAELLSQRARAVSELVELENVKLEHGLVGVVFSKDRALQLYTLLRSYFDLVENPVSIFIIYNASEGSHAKAYREVETAFQAAPVRLTFIRERASFREHLLETLAQVWTRNIFFLVDDIVFIRRLNFEVASKINPLESILSFRHSPHLRRSYTGAVDQLPPSFSPSGFGEDLRRFNWFEQGCEWSDPWSVDGQILSTAEIRVLSRISDFKAPNSYEGMLKGFNDIARNRDGMCYTESKILNLPINRVQSEITNRSGHISAEYLLDQWNRGMMLDTSMFDAHIPRAPHEEHPIRFKLRSGSFEDFRSPLRNPVE